MSHVEELLAAAKRYRQAVNARYRAEAWSKFQQTTDAEVMIEAAREAEEDATANLLEVAGRVG